ncbi:MAG: FAD:protein FMN transferase [Longimicrobiales bacterium]|nr:FAD:protein FMN transferase [Longimicrobiales bacterium]
MEWFQAVMKRRKALKIGGISAMTAIGSIGVMRSVLAELDFDLVKETRTKMGTLVTISVVHRDVSIARTIIDEAFVEIDRLEALFSRYREGTPLWVLNREGILENPPSEMLEVLTHALEIDTLTDGAFDVTVAPLVDLYSNSFEEMGELPSEVQIENALSLVGSQGINFDRDKIVFERDGMSLSFDGIAKGYIVDQAVKIIKKEGVRGGLIDAGGDMRATGEDLLGESWRLAIQHPRNPGSYLCLIDLSDGAVATSGDYMQYLTEDFIVHHIVDPRLGTSPDHTSSVSVIASTAAEADALSTATLVLGPEKGIRLLNELPGVEGILVTKDQEVIKTEEFSRYEVTI